MMVTMMTMMNLIMISDSNEDYLIKDDDNDNDYDDTNDNFDDDDDDN